MSVVELLNELAPGWSLTNGGSGIDMAVAAIRKLCARSETGFSAGTIHSMTGDCPTCGSSVHEKTVSAIRPKCPFCDQSVYARPENTRAEGPPAHLQTRKKCPTCPYFNGCMVGDCDYGN